MPMQWVFTSAFLPSANEPVQFLFDACTAPMRGTYSQGVFSSGQVAFDASRVHSWRTMIVKPVRVARVMVDNAHHNAWFRTLAVLSPRRPEDAPEPLTQVCAKKVPIAVHPLRETSRPERHQDSNQMSS
jgi:hypothetical protein